jgi:hypothetical protein
MGQEIDHLIASQTGEGERVILMQETDPDDVQRDYEVWS